MKIVQRVPGYSDEMMLEDCNRMLMVLTQTKDVKVGRGRASTTIKTPKYRVDEEIIQKIKNSIEYYEFQILSRGDNTEGL